MLLRKVQLSALCAEEATCAPPFAGQWPVTWFGLHQLRGRVTITHLLNAMCLVNVGIRFICRWMATTASNPPHQGISTA
eukprot:scaffold100720_cov17-Tisochrysis_lutea.AAC.2